tara:strand:- start:1471 stop:1875 length:405 start_codon:yes stop_codon:yes gene_type:complete
LQTILWGHYTLKKVSRAKYSSISKVISIASLFLLCAGSVRSSETLVFDVPTELLELPGDVEYGEYLANDCKTCHEADGGGEGIPNIHGRPTIQLITLLYAYREKIKSNDVMQMQAGQLTDDEIAALAAYFEGLN